MEAAGSAAAGFLTSVPNLGGQGGHRGQGLHNNVLGPAATKICAGAILL